MTGMERGLMGKSRWYEAGVIHLVKRKFKDLDSTINLTQLLHTCVLSADVPDSCRTSHWGLGVKVDLIHTWHWTMHWVTDCRMTFHTHLSTGIKMFRNLNLTAVPPIVSGGQIVGKRHCLFARTVTSASDNTIQVALSDALSFVNSLGVLYQWVATLQIWCRPQPAWSWGAVTRNEGSGRGGRTMCGI